VRGAVPTKDCARRFTRARVCRRLSRMPPLPTQADGLAQTGDFVKVCVCKAHCPLGCLSAHTDGQHGATAGAWLRRRRPTPCVPVATRVLCAGAHQLPAVGAPPAADPAGDPRSRRRHHLPAGAQPLWCVCLRQGAAAVASQLVLSVVAAAHQCLFRRCPCCHHLLHHATRACRAQTCWRPRWCPRATRASSAPSSPRPQ
jgi:hypothetical protein